MNSDGNDEDEEEMLRSRERKGLRAFTELDDIRREIRSRPRRLCHEFVEEQRRLMGARVGELFNRQEARAKLQWGRHAGLQRVGAMMMEILELADAVPTDCRGTRVLRAQVIQCYRAVCQAALDGGAWHQTWLLSGLEEPITRRKFAAPSHQISIMSNYLKANQELSKQLVANKTVEGGECGQGQ